MIDRSGQILLGTVAIEPNRWSTADPSGAPQVRVGDWVGAIADAGFDGLELWEPHLPARPSAPDAAAVLHGPLRPIVFNSYVGFDDPDPTARRAAAGRVAEAGSAAVKFNVGTDASAADRYAEHLAGWVEDLPEGVVALCECHVGLSIAEDPEVAARLFDAADDRGRVGAIVHTHEQPDHLRRRFDAYGDRVSHVHVNYLDTTTMAVPPLAERLDDLAAKVALLDELGFDGSWTIEFVAGLLTERDEPEALVAQAGQDLAVLRELVGSVPG